MELRDTKRHEHRLNTDGVGIRDLLQPVVVTLCLLRGSESSSAVDGRCLDDVDGDCEELTRVPRDRLKEPLER